VHVRFAQIEPTTRCNFTCGFCCGRHMDQTDLDYGRFEAIVAAINAVLAEQARHVRDDRAADRPLAELTKAQLEVLRLMAAGYGNDAIAQRRECSVSAVQNLVVGIYRRLGYREFEREWCLERRAPQDRSAGPASA
jgi:DNA-binding NarL/FixJ family response regulator